MRPATHCPDLPTLAAWQAATDGQLIRRLDGVDAAAPAGVVAVDRVSRAQHGRRDDLRSHLFRHRTHHGGQVHGMLSATAVAPPQPDGLNAGEGAAARAEAMGRLRWSEAVPMRPAAVRPAPRAPPYAEDPAPARRGGCAALPPCGSARAGGCRPRTPADISAKMKAAGMPPGARIRRMSGW
jgi:hypothetical protein